MNLGVDSKSLTAEDFLREARERYESKRKNRHEIPKDVSRSIDSLREEFKRLNDSITDSKKNQISPRLDEKYLDRSEIANDRIAGAKKRIAESKAKQRIADSKRLAQEVLAWEKNTHQPLHEAGTIKHAQNITTSVNKRVAEVPAISEVSVTKANKDSSTLKDDSNALNLESKTSSEDSTSSHVTVVETTFLDTDLEKEMNASDISASVSDSVFADSAKNAISSTSAESRDNESNRKNQEVCNKMQNDAPESTTSVSNTEYEYLQADQEQIRNVIDDSPCKLSTTTTDTKDDKSSEDEPFQQSEGTLNKMTENPCELNDIDTNMTWNNSIEEMLPQTASEDRNQLTDGAHELKASTLNNKEAPSQPDEETLAKINDSREVIASAIDRDDATKNSGEVNDAATSSIGQKSLQGDSLQKCPEELSQKDPGDSSGIDNEACDLNGLAMKDTAKNCSEVNDVATNAMGQKLLEDKLPKKGPEVRNRFYFYDTPELSASQPNEQTLGNGNDSHEMIVSAIDCDSTTKNINDVATNTIGQKLLEDESPQKRSRDSREMDNEAGNLNSVAMNAKDKPLDEDESFPKSQEASNGTIKDSLYSNKSDTKTTEDNSPKVESSSQESEEINKDTSNDSRKLNAGTSSAQNESLLDDETSEASYDQLLDSSEEIYNHATSTKPSDGSVMTAKVSNKDIASKSNSSYLTEKKNNIILRDTSHTSAYSTSKYIEAMQKDNNSAVAPSWNSKQNKFKIKRGGSSTVRIQELLKETQVCEEKLETLKSDYDAAGNFRGSESRALIMNSLALVEKVLEKRKQKAEEEISKIVKETTTNNSSDASVVQASMNRSLDDCDTRDDIPKVIITSDRECKEARAHDGDQKVKVDIIPNVIITSEKVGKEAKTNDVSAPCADDVAQEVESEVDLGALFDDEVRNELDEILRVAETISSGKEDNEDTSVSHTSIVDESQPKRLHNQGQNSWISAVFPCGIGT